MIVENNRYSTIGKELTLASTSPRDSYLGSECLLQGKSRAKQLDGPFLIAAMVSLPVTLQDQCQCQRSGQVFKCPQPRPAHCVLIIALFPDKMDVQKCCHLQF